MGHTVLLGNLQLMLWLYRHTYNFRSVQTTILDEINQALKQSYIILVNTHPYITHTKKY